VPSTELAGAILTSADLTTADLAGAKLTSADLARADLASAGMAKHQRAAARDSREAEARGAPKWAFGGALTFAAKDPAAIPKDAARNESTQSSPIAEPWSTPCPLAVAGQDASQRREFGGFPDLRSFEHHETYARPHALPQHLDDVTRCFSRGARPPPPTDASDVSAAERAVRRRPMRRRAAAIPDRRLGRRVRYARGATRSPHHGRTSVRDGLRRCPPRTIPYQPQAALRAKPTILVRSDHRCAGYLGTL